MSWRKLLDNTINPAEINAAQRSFIEPSFIFGHSFSTTSSKNVSMGGGIFVDIDGEKDDIFILTANAIVYQKHGELGFAYLVLEQNGHYTETSPVDQIITSDNNKRIIPYIWVIEFHDKEFITAEIKWRSGKGTKLFFSGMLLEARKL